MKWWPWRRRERQMATGRREPARRVEEWRSLPPLPATLSGSAPLTIPVTGSSVLDRLTLPEPTLLRRGDQVGQVHGLVTALPDDGRTAGPHDRAPLPVFGRGPWPGVPDGPGVLDGPDHAPMSTVDAEPRALPARVGDVPESPLTVAAPRWMAQPVVPEEPWTPSEFMHRAYLEKDRLLAEAYRETNGEAQPRPQPVAAQAEHVDDGRADTSFAAPVPVPSEFAPSVPTPSVAALPVPVPSVLMPSGPGPEPGAAVPPVRRASLAQARRQGLTLSSAPATPPATDAPGHARGPAEGDALTSDVPVRDAGTPDRPDAHQPPDRAMPDAPAGTAPDDAVPPPGPEPEPLARPELAPQLEPRPVSVREREARPEPEAATVWPPEPGREPQPQSPRLGPVLEPRPVPEQEPRPEAALRRPEPERGPDLESAAERELGPDVAAGSERKSWLAPEAAAVPPPELGSAADAGSRLEPEATAVPRPEPERRPGLEPEWRPAQEPESDAAALSGRVSRLGPEAAAAWPPEPGRESRLGPEVAAVWPIEPGPELESSADAVSRPGQGLAPDAATSSGRVSRLGPEAVAVRRLEPGRGPKLESAADAVSRPESAAVSRPGRGPEPEMAALPGRESRLGPEAVAVRRLELERGPELESAADAVSRPEAVSRPGRELEVEAGAVSGREPWPEQGGVPEVALRGAVPSAAVPVNVVPGRVVPDEVSRGGEARSGRRPGAATEGVRTDGNGQDESVAAQEGSLQHRSASAAGRSVSHDVHRHTDAGGVGLHGTRTVPLAPYPDASDVRRLAPAGDAAGTGRRAGAGTAVLSHAPSSRAQFAMGDGTSAGSSTSDGRGTVDESPPLSVVRPVSLALGVDVSDVTVRRGPDVTAMSHRLGARGYTDDRVVYLPDDVGPLDSSSVAPLLAHELTHAAQQRDFGSALPAPGSVAGQQLEEDAVEVERWVAGGAGGSPPVLVHPVGGAKQQASGTGLTSGSGSRPSLAEALAVFAGSAPDRPDLDVRQIFAGVDPATGESLIPDAAYEMPALDVASLFGPDQPGGGGSGPGGDGADGGGNRLGGGGGTADETVAALAEGIAEIFADEPPRRWFDLDDVDDFEELAGRIYNELVSRIRFDMVVDRERSGTLLDFS